MDNRALHRIAGLTLALAAAFAACDERPTSPDRARADRQSLAAEQDSGAVEFEGEVASVDTSGGTLTLADSTVVAVDSATEWDDGGDYGSLGEIAAALSDTTSDAPDAVVAEGEGSEQGGGSVLASEIEAEAEEEEPAEFEGAVASVDVDSGTVTLDDSTVVRVDSATDWDSTGDYGSLEEIAAALSNTTADDTTSDSTETSGASSAVFFASDTTSGDTATTSDTTSTDSTTVVVEGEGAEQADGSVLASRIKAEAEDGEDGEKPTAGEEVEFEGDVLAVHGKSEHHQLNLEGGQRIAVDSATEWTGAYGSLDAVAAAVDSGRTVHADGSGVEEHDGSVAADEIEAGPKTTEFSGEVASVNPKNGNHQVRLDGGTRLTVPDDASWSGDASGLDELDTVADTASSVTVEGEGTLGRNGVVTVVEIEVEVSADDGSQGQGGKGGRGGQGNGGSGNSGNGNSGNGQGNSGNGNGNSGNSGNGNGQGQGNGNGGQGNGGNNGSGNGSGNGKGGGKGGGG